MSSKLTFTKLKIEGDGTLRIWRLVSRNDHLSGAGGMVGGEEQLVKGTDRRDGRFKIECVAVLPIGEEDDVWAVGGVGVGGLGEGMGMRVWSGGVDGKLRWWDVPSSITSP